MPEVSTPRLAVPSTQHQVPYHGADRGADRGALCVRAYVAGVIQGLCFLLW